MLKALTNRFLSRMVAIYSVDVEVELDLKSTQPRTIIVPHNVPASSEEEACRLALEKERKEVRVIPRRGEPRIHKVRKIEMKGEDW